ncbi:MAG TPA: GatB/YqeY domain-containing protein [Candidatus Limnocylindrales bacterium]|nr:GatB/YqeY domain-containing protein [Candidatus Limnocylindrales bacterium]
MTEKELRERLSAAMREKQPMRMRALRAILAGVKNRGIELRGEVPEKEITTIIQREAKQCRETLDFATKAGRDDQVAEHQALLTEIETLLPQALSEEELRQAILAIVAETSATSIGPVMKTLGDRYAGRYDGKRASELIRAILGT